MQQNYHREFVTSLLNDSTDPTKFKQKDEGGGWDPSLLNDSFFKIAPYIFLIREVRETKKISLKFSFCDNPFLRLSST